MMNTYATHSVCKTLIALFTALNMFTNSVSFFTGGNDRGSAGDINGTTIVITLFVSDVEYGWSVKNNEDIEQALDKVDQELLVKQLGIGKDICISCRRIWKKLQKRRLGRGSR